MYQNLLPDVLATGPILLVALVGIAAVLVDAFRNDTPSIPWIAGAGLLAALVLELFKLDDAGFAFNGHVVTGGAAAFGNVVILVGALLSVALSPDYLRRIGHGYGEVYAMLLFATCGAMVLASAGSLITLFVGLETMSVCLYVLTGLVREEERANESALKYFLLGAFSTGFLLYGVALMYGASGTMVLGEMGPGVAASGRTALFVGGLALLLVGFFFKVAAVPFHMWTPDVYQGAPTTITGYMATASKAAAFGGLILVLARAVPLGLLAEEARFLLAGVAAVTMVVGNVLAITQRNVKRMLAYSSVAHAGYVLTGLAAASEGGYGGALFYLLAYTVMNVGAFGVMAYLEWDHEQGAEQTVDSLAGIGYRRPLLGVTMGVFMFALTGFPPLAGFIGKYLVFAAAIDAGLTWLAVVGVLASVVSAFYYLRVLVSFWMKGEEEQTEAVRAQAFPVPALAAAVLVGCAVALLGLGVLPGEVIEAATGFFAGPVQTAVLP